MQNKLKILKMFFEYFLNLDVDRKEINENSLMIYRYPVKVLKLIYIQILEILLKIKI